MPSQIGSAVWHMLQRPEHHLLRLGEGHRLGRSGGRVLLAARAGPAALSSTIATMPAAATPQVHQGDGRPLWRLL